MNSEINRKTIFADLSLILVAIIWGSGFIFMKNVLDYISPIHILALRFTISTVVMSVIFFKKVKAIKMPDIKAGSLIGVFLFIAFIAQTIGLQYTTVSNQAFITASNVVLVPFLYWFVSKNKPGVVEIIAVLLCFVGIGILSLDANFSIGLGDGFTMLCAVFFACHIVSIGLFSKQYDPITLTIIQFAVASILSIAGVLIMKTPLNNLTKEVIYPIIYLSLVSTILAFGIQNVAQKYTSSTHAAIILSMESVFGSIFAILFLKEFITMKLILGSIIVLASVILAETKLEFILKKEKIDTAE